ncbi:TrmH family RNA methyltransferase [Photobacterium phosphoreum]|jgi:tRNA(Leu) C34 or U34 (ribose-2'-O)-methylase TrmL|uniref:23S rRNA methyltransferase n=1 Tax=Photobacterium phosphoreum TaxID=659 RepID=A0A2T3JIC0_PHOPO|nr:RNA methyltransferase [Photobacterium phosphoreum]KJF85851.1 23S rRNA methyltransferase [Photobacterium phosphoreum]MCD9462842.1 23S rRNA methyltransferase [Photobacterium phosphoreum]MCD9470205.1 23S rRNA methyltransferase [Photobacterium phosphoreum]MCD9477047.1 TrmH family RNA methyltransferase [Photobacterium phosphoreum]MCD9478755.1 TrmH family RNA methyltransferase [Photobacterium phosphoreum]
MKDASVIIGLSNPKSPTNIGAVLRAAGCYKADAVIYTGTRYDKAAKFQTDTKKMAQTIPLSGVESMLDDLPQDMKIVCVDFAEGATLLPYFQHPEKAIYIFGPEDGSISQDVADRADHVVYVPTVGCMNLAASVNVVLYDRLAKQENITQSDEHIRQNRDNKNNLRVNVK